ncbi:MFS transporter [Paeniglutamicibacter psychrophenolicus]|uniref:CP family cyanate transporter-like MFS transporter n=1 Tax=Paeniglutamicibacter psychrophenolicus TaxID=257454 RepID=A0ABS4WBR1_9MICC|nr:MFS transporter [Paeniglutamicibacter psychrophenolicus]MBP2373358.1 CP family cyanate transporter-like MFS transporter [Paeniglutamicibacter psychrophenolicus]
MQPPDSKPQQQRTQPRGFMVLSILAVVLIGLNLRAGITSAAPLFLDLQEFLGYGAFVAALLPSIPTLVFAAAGLSTAWLARRLGLSGTILFALCLLSAGLAFRALPTTWALLAGTVAAMCGLALCNVSMPSFIRENFAQKTSLMTGLYTITMSLGATAASALSVPLALAAGSPTLGLATWSILAAAAALAFLPFMLMARADRPGAPATSGISPFSLIRTKRGLVITGLFSAQAILAYAIMSWLPTILISRSMAAADAGVILGVLQVMSIPATMFSLWLVNKHGMLRGAFFLTSISAAAGLAGLVWLPLSLAWLCAVVLGIGFSIFPLVLLVISFSGESSEETTAMSTLAQSLGYLVATSGPFGMGLLYSLTGSWTVPLVLLIGVTGVMLWLGVVASGYRRAVVQRVQ